MNTINSVCNGTIAKDCTLGPSDVGLVLYESNIRISFEKEFYAELVRENNKHSLYICDFKTQGDSYLCRIWDREYVPLLCDCYESNGYWGELISNGRGHYQTVLPYNGKFYLFSEEICRSLALLWDGFTSSSQ